jgi:membrane protein
MAILLIMLVLVFAPVALRAFSEFTDIEVPFKLARFFHSYFVYIGAVALFVMVASMYYVLPNIKQTLHSVVPGALLVVALWIAGAALVSFYLTSISQVTLIYGSLSGFIATLIFFYVMNLIFIYGAEFNHECMVAMGKHIIEREPPQHVTVH